jgi:hypothetical protein
MCNKTTYSEDLPEPNGCCGGENPDCCQNEESDAGDAIVQVRIRAIARHERTEGISIEFEHDLPIVEDRDGEGRTDDLQVGLSVVGIDENVAPLFDFEIGKRYIVTISECANEDDE